MTDHIARRPPGRAAIDSDSDDHAAFVFDPDGYRIEAVCHRLHS